MVKRLFAFTVSLIMTALLALWCAAASETDMYTDVTSLKNKPLAKLVDTSDLLTDSEEAELTELMESFAEANSINYAIVIEDVPGDLQTTADDMYDSMRTTDDFSDNGMLVLVDMEGGDGERGLQFSTSGNLIEFVDTDFLNDTYNTAVDILMNGDIYSALHTITSDFIGYFSNDDYDYEIPYDNNNDAIYINGVKQMPKSTKIIILVAVIVAAGVIVGLASVLIVKKGYTDNGKTKDINSNAKANTNLTRNEDKLENRFVTTRVVPKNPPPSNNSSGGFSGGGSHMSSGGFSHGGGGGRF